MNLKNRMEDDAEMDELIYRQALAEQWMESRGYEDGAALAQRYGGDITLIDPDDPDYVKAGGQRLFKVPDKAERSEVCKENSEAWVAQIFGPWLPVGVDIQSLEAAVLESAKQERTAYFRRFFEKLEQLDADNPEARAASWQKHGLLEPWLKAPELQCLDPEAAIRAAAFQLATYVGHGFAHDDQADQVALANRFRLELAFQEALEDAIRIQDSGHESQVAGLVEHAWRAYLASGNWHAMVEALDAWFEDAQAPWNLGE